MDVFWTSLLVLDPCLLSEVGCFDSI